MGRPTGATMNIHQLLLMRPGIMTQLPGWVQLWYARVASTRTTSCTAAQAMRNCVYRRNLSRLRLLTTISMAPVYRRE